MANFSKWLGASRDDGPDSAAAEAVRTRLAAVEFYLPKAANDYNKSIEFVHQSRVWSRRSAAAIEVFEEFLPPQRMRRLQKALKQIRRACNDARDDDVFAVRLAADKQNKNARHLLEMVREHRKRSQQPIVQAHDELIANGKLSRRTAKLIGRIRFRDETNGDHERPDFGQWSAGRLQSLVDEFFEAAREDFSEYANLHAFRIVGKKVRYALELLHGAFAVSVRETVYPAIEDLQERLGEINDHVTTQSRLERWIEHAENEGDKEYLAAMLDDEQQKLTACTEAFFQWWTPAREQDLRTQFEQLTLEFR